jgi:zeaxanthin epoxidase
MELRGRGFTSWPWPCTHVAKMTREDAMPNFITGPQESVGKRDPQINPRIPVYEGWRFHEGMFVLTLGSSALTVGISPGRAHSSGRTSLIAAIEVSPPSARPLKVAIAGGGVGGLTTALAMLKAGFDVTVYEKTGQFARFGGPIQFASNALSTIKAIDERLFTRVMEKFTFTGTRRCGIKDGLRSDGTFRMTDVAEPRYLVDASVPADWYLAFPLKECADFFQLPCTGVVNRPDLQEILLDECRQLKPDFLQNSAAVQTYEHTADGVALTLVDGSTVDADVLVGSDGIWSAVRAKMYDEGEVKAMSADGRTQQGCPYSGYTVFAGEFVPKQQSDFADYFECGYKVYIGPGKYFVTSDVGNGRVQWYSFIAQPPGTKRASDSWEGGESTDDEGADVISYLKGLHEGWTDEIRYVLDSTPAGSVEQRDLYDRWPEFRRSWADGSVVLVGDAVHPMMPNLGQGGCQAIEDAYELTKVLQSVTLSGAAPSDPALVRDALQRFYKKRVLRVAGVSLLSRLASDLIINFFDTPWSPHDSKGQTALSYLTFCWKPLLQYLVFPMQFLFLYSFHPSGSMGDLPRRLEAEWRERHRPDAEAAFARSAETTVAEAAPSFFANTQ